MLTGSQDQRILEKQHDRLSTYGLLDEFRKSVVRDWIEQLIGQGCAIKFGEYNQLQVTEKGRQVLRGELTPKLLKPASKQSRRQGSVDPSSWEGVDRQLFESLRTLLSELASAQGVPAYIVFGDATLRDLARRRPSTVESFLEVHGVGQKKCEDYGQRFLECIADYCAGENVEQDIACQPANNTSPATQESTGLSPLPFATATAWA